MNQPEKVHVYARSFEGFLKEVQDRVLQGYRVDTDRANGVFWAGFACDMYLEIPWVKNEAPEPVEGKGPFTAEQMEAAEWESFRTYVKENYKLTDRNRKNLIKKVLALYAEAGFNDSTTQEEYDEYIGSLGNTEE